MVEGFFLIVFLAAYSILCFARLEAAVLFIIAALPLYVVRFSVLSLPSTLLEAMIFCLLAAWLYQKTKQRGWKDFLRGLTEEKVGRVLLVAVACVLFFATIGIVVSPNTWAAVGVWRAYFIEPAIFFFILLDSLKSRQMIQQTFFASIVSAFSIACIALYQGIAAEWGAGNEIRATSIFPYPNAVGLYVAPIMPFVFGAFALISRKNYSQNKKILFTSAGVLCIVTMIGAIVFSQTEAALAAVAVSAALFLFCLSKQTRKAAASLVVLSFLIVIFVQPLTHYFSQKIFLQDWSGKVRKGIWKETTAMLQDHWFTGAGLSGYKTVFTPYHTRTHIEIFQYPHSFVLNFWSEIGLFGLFSLLFLLGMFFFFVLGALAHSRHLPRSEEAYFLYTASLALLCSMTIILVHGLVDVPYFKNDLSIFFWVLIAISFRLYQIEKKRSISA